MEKVNKLNSNDFCLHPSQTPRPVIQSEGKNLRPKYIRYIVPTHELSI